MSTLLRIAGFIPAYPTRGKGPAGASKRETPTSNLTESTEQTIVHITAKALLEKTTAMFRLNSFDSFTL